jgi:histidinol-phosphate aminotransferase
MVYRDRLLHFDPDSVLGAVTPQTKIIVIANPNNPTGNFMAPEHFVRFAETGIPFIVDEAYVEFAGLGMSQVALTRTYPNVIITRTLSKAYGLAGMRFGYALGHKDTIGQISAALLPWNVGTIPMWAALAALEDTKGLEERIEFNNAQVRFIQDSLKDIPGLNIFFSHGNYILFDGGPAGVKGDDVVAFAQEKGLILRPQGKMYGSDGFFRITIGTAEENQAAVQTIQQFFANQVGKPRL